MNEWQDVIDQALGIVNEVEDDYVDQLYERYKVIQEAYQRCPTMYLEAELDYLEAALQDEIDRLKPTRSTRE